MNNLSIHEKYYLRVFGENQSVIYNIKYNIVQYDDFYELNNNYTQAYNITNSEDGRCIQNNDDWFIINITNGYQHLYINYFFESNDGYLVLNIFDGNLSLILNYNIIRSSSGQYLYQFLHLQGVYYIKFNGSDTGEYYRFSCSYLQNPLDDNYEINNDPNTAFDLTIHRRTWLSSINGLGTYIDKDWFKFNITSEEQFLILKLTYLFPIGNLNIVIYNSSLHLIEFNTIENSNNYCEFNLETEGIYYLKINGSYGLYYDLWWDDVRNDIPIILDISPEDESFGIKNSILLNYSIFDPDGDPLNVHIYNAKEKMIINSIFGVQSGSSHTYLWNNLTSQEIYHWFILVDDGMFQISSPIKSFITCSPPNPPECLEPSNGAVDVSLSPRLSIFLSDPDSEYLNISFYNAFDDSLIDAFNNVNNDSEIFINWIDLSENTIYEWYIIVDDGIFQIKSATWNFKTINIENGQNIPIFEITIALICFGGSLGGIIYYLRKKRSQRYTE